MPPRPLYHRVADDLRAALDAGTYPEGSLLPGRHELCREHKCSLSTLNHALEVLVAEGRLDRARGRGAMVLGRPVASERWDRAMALVAELRAELDELRTHFTHHPQVGPVV